MVAAALSLPDLWLRYFWDDYWFLSHAQRFSLEALLPGRDVFYRPISRVLYFLPLAPLGSQGAIYAHGLNLVLVLASVGLLALFVERLAGSKAGAIAGIGFASLCSLPALVAWVSASQDLLAILFILIAFHLRLSGRIVVAAVFFAAGLLSKETIAVLAPALVFLDEIVARKPSRTLRAAGAIGIVLAAWLLLHPGIHELVASRFEIKPREYVGFSNLALAKHHAGQYALALFNIPQGGVDSWSWVWFALAFFVVCVSAAGLMLLAHGPPGRANTHLPIARGVLLAIAIGAPALVLASLVLSTWARYLICIPAIGASILLSVLLSRAPLPVAAITLGIYALLGLAIRGTPSAETVTELQFAEASRSISRIETAFKKLHPTLPRESQLLVSVAATGSLGIHGTMHDGQAPRIWYRDPTLQVVRPERRAAPRGPEYLFRVTGSDVWEIDPEGESVRTSGGIADREEVRAVIRTYARGLAASGDTARATRILRRLAAGDPELWASYDLRIAAMGMLAARDSVRAARLLSEARPIPRDFALYAIAKVMGEPTGRAALDSTAFTAFGISDRDPDAVRDLMNVFYGSLFVSQARDLALKLRELAPGDSESAYILERLGTSRGPEPGYKSR